MVHIEDDNDPVSPENGGALYRVGNKRPPKHSQWQQGESGNARGRPRGSLNLATRVLRELRKRVVVTRGGRQVKIGKLEIFISQLVDNSIKGDTKSAVILLNLCREVDAVAQSKSAHDAPTSGFVIPDRENLKFIADRLTRLTDTEDGE